MSRAWSRGAVLFLLGSTAVLAESLQPRVDLRFEADRISMEELSRLLPALDGVELPPHVQITRLEAEGPLAHVTVDFAMRSPNGSVEGQAIVNATSPVRRVRGTATVDNLDLAELLDRPSLPGALTATVEFNLRFDAATPGVLSGTFEVKTSRLAAFGYTVRQLVATGRIADQQIAFEARGDAYGADVAAHGIVSFADALTFEVEGSASDVNLTQLPRSLELPRVASDVALDFQLSGSGAGTEGRVELRASTIAGARLRPGTTATFDARGDGLTLHAKGGVTDLDPSRVGELFELGVLRDDRFKGTLDATYNIQLRGGTLQSADIEISQARLFGGTISHLTVVATPSADALAFSARGRFSGVDPGVISQRPEIDGSLTGTLDVSGVVPKTNGQLSVERLDLAGSVLLDSSTFEGVAVASGAVVASVTNGARVQIDRAEFVSPSLDARLSGAYGIDATVPTNLRYEVSASELRTLGRPLGIAVSGEGSASGTVSGTDILRVNGALTVARLSYDRVGLRGMSGQYNLRLNREAPAASDVTAHLEIDELVVADQELGGATGELTYVDRRLTFDVNTRHAERSLGAAGDLVWHASDQEIHLRHVMLDTRAGVWQLAPQTEATARYGSDHLTIEDLRLVSAPNQFIRVNGSFDAAEDPLRVDAGNVQLAPFAAALGEPQLHGELTGHAVVAGELASPTIDAEFELRSATFRGLDFQTVTGTADLGDRRFDFGLRLTRPDGTWLQADGHVPSAVVRSGDIPADAPLAVTVTSSLIDLQILEAFTTAVQDVAGTLQIDATWEGSLANPALDGQIAIRDGAFSVPALGTRYTGLDTTVLLQPSNVIVDAARLVDDDGDWLTVSGRLPIGELLEGKVRLALEAESFELVDNDIADLEATMNVEIGGNLRLPDVTGLIDIVNGQIHVDQVLELSADRRRSASRVATKVSQRAPGAMPVEEGLLANLPIALNVHLRADRLLLTGRDLRAGNVPIGVGDINLVADGDLTLQKAREGPLRLRGDVRTVRGTYEFQNREFELMRGGTIRFVGDPTVNPRLDITAGRTISAVETRVHVGGTLANPTLQLSSNPPLDQADILSMIVFNQPTIDLGTGARASLAQRAAALGAGFLASEISEAISDAVGLDIVDIDAGAIRGDEFAPVFTVGEQFGDLFLKFRQQVGAESASQVVIEYTVTDWFRIESSFVERRRPAQPSLRRLEGSGIDGVFSWEFGAPAATASKPAPTAGGASARRPQQ